MTVHTRQETQIFKTGGFFILTGLFIAVIALTLTAACLIFAFRAPIPSSLIWLRIVLVVFSVFPLMVSAVGVLVSLGGEHITIDPSARRVDIAHGRWYVWKRVSLDLDQFDSVHLHAQSNTVGTDRSASVTYPVRLLAEDNEIHLGGHSQYGRARQVAESVAANLNIPLVDQSMRETSTRTPESLNESIAQRAHRLGQSPEWPRLPRNSAVKTFYEYDAAVIELPRPNRKLIVEGVISIVFLLVVYGGLLGGVAYAASNAIAQLTESRYALVWQVLIWSVPIIPIVYFVLFGTMMLTTRERIEISPRLLRRRWRFPVGLWTKTIPVGEIEEILTDSDSCIVRTDRTTLNLGFALDKKHRTWLQSAVRYLLVNSAKLPMNP